MKGKQNKYGSGYTIHIGGEEYTVYTKILSQPHCILCKYGT